MNKRLLWHMRKATFEDWREFVLCAGWKGTVTTGNRENM